MCTKPTPLKDMIPPPRTMSWWFYLPLARLSPKHQEYVHLLCEADADLNELYLRAQAFAELVHAHSSASLTAWMTGVSRSCADSSKQCDAMKPPCVRDWICPGPKARSKGK